MAVPARLPRYRELPVIEKTGEHHAWGIFGEGDEIGTVNFAGPDQVLCAVRTVSTGRVVNLTLPLNLPRPALSGGRDTYIHHIEVTQSARDDSLDGFFLQASSHWDALCHIRYREFGYYGGRHEEEIDQGALGMDTLARHGITGRGVLVDFARYFEQAGSPVNPTERIAFGPQDVEKVLAWAGTEVRQGDILLFRTGWLRWYLSHDEQGRADLAGTLHGGAGGLECPGLAPSADTAEWLWDHGVAAVAADNPAFEVLRVRREEGFLHRRILALLGMPIGEFWYLEELSHVCKDLDRYHFLLVSAPLNLPKGVGSPNNAYAIV